MPTYKANRLAPTWRFFLLRVLSAQGRAIQSGATVTGQAVGVDLNGFTILQLAGGLFTKRTFFDLLPDPDPLPPPTQPPTPEPLPQGLWVVRGDEELPEFEYRSRTAAPDWPYGALTPSVFRFGPVPVRRPLVDRADEYRVDITPMDAALRHLNGYDGDINRINYLYSSGTALFNRQGFPRLQYLTMSNNLLQGLGIEAGCLKFLTCKPHSNTAGLTHVSHPWFVQKWDIVTRRQGQTLHVPTPHGNVYWFLTTNEGFGYIPLRFVRPYPYSEE